MMHIENNKTLNEGKTNKNAACRNWKNGDMANQFKMPKK